MANTKFHKKEPKVIPGIFCKLSTVLFRCNFQNGIQPNQHPLDFFLFIRKSYQETGGLTGK